MLGWLKQQRQTQRAIDRFWRVVLVSALDEELDQTDARFGIDVFWKAFLCNSRGYRMGVPIVPLAELYDGCRAFIEKKGGEVTLRSAVRGIKIENNSVASFSFDNNREESADAYVFAVPHDTFAELLPPEIAANRSCLPQSRQNQRRPHHRRPFLVRSRSHQRAVHHAPRHHRPVGLQQDRPLRPTPQPRQTACRGDAANSKTSAAKQYLQLVISASYDLLQKPRQEIIDLCLKEVRQALPAAREANLVKATVIKEAAATFSPQPGVDRWRPKQETA